VTLSFDNGGEAEVTPSVLDTLARHSIKASFFVMERKLGTPRGEPSPREQVPRAIGSAITRILTRSRLVSWIAPRLSANLSRQRNPLPG
jgi:peptidoglycan/xylan/chitin deacetylase (PgdA/CDA1 family)